MTGIYRQINSPRKARLRDFVMSQDGVLEPIVSISIYPPVDRVPDGIERPPLCPIRSDWWAVAIHTPSAQTEWRGEPDHPGPR